MTKLLIIVLVAVPLWIVFNKIEKFFIDKSSDRVAKKLLEGKYKEVSLENPKYGIIELFENGFQIRNNKNTQKVKIEWNDIKEIFTYKRDLYTTDLICLGWTLSKTNKMVETHEEMLGFKKLCDAMLDQFKKIPVTWYIDVAHPAFKTNGTLLWSKTDKS